MNPEESPLSRRGFIKAVLAATGSSFLSACGAGRGPAPSLTLRPSPTIPTSTPLPVSAHADITEPLLVSAHADITEGPVVLPVRFNAEAIGGTPPYEYYWDFDSSDGIQVDKNHRAPSFVFGTPGNYLVTLIVKDSMGISATTHLDITALPGDYTPGEPLRLINIHGTPEDPVVIEGLDISTANNNGIALVQCSYFTIRDNYIHDVNYDDVEMGIYGNAIYVQDSSHIEIANNLIINNLRGVWVNATPGSPFVEDIDIHDNVVIGNRLANGIKVGGADGVEIGNNYLRDNGDILFFERHRITGIIAWDSVNIRIHDNISIGSSSDGFGIATSIELQNAQEGFCCRDIEIYNNTSRGNGEQGIWLSVVSGGSVHGNYISGNRNPRDDLGSSGIMLDGDVIGLQIFNNNIIDNEVSGIAINSSSNNEVYENVISSPISGWGGIWIHQNPQSWFENQPSMNNLMRNNIIFDSTVGIAIEAGGNNAIVNNTIYGNGLHFSGAGGILIRPQAAGTVITNNIIAWNDGAGLLDQSGLSNVTYNTFFQNTRNISGVTPGEGNIFDDPRFVAADLGNFRLLPDSPCRDTGDPNSDFSQEPFPNGGRIDMGAFGNLEYQ